MTQLNVAPEVVPPSTALFTLKDQQKKTYSGSDNAFEFSEHVTVSIVHVVCVNIIVVYLSERFAVCNHGEALNMWLYCCVVILFCVVIRLCGYTLPEVMWLCGY